MGIRAVNIGKTLGEPPTRILSGITLDIADGEYVAVTGRSGSGKSSLLYLLSTLDGVSEGMVEVDGHDVRSMPNAALDRFRNAQAGFVFQFHYLLGELTVLENVLLPARKMGRTAQQRQQALALLDRVGLADKPQRLPRQLSGGEQQRVAIARALVMRPRYLFADEPTGSLDSENSETVLRLIKETNQKDRTTVVLVTHDLGFAAQAMRQIRLVDGRIANVIGVTE